MRRSVLRPVCRLAGLALLLIVFAPPLAGAATVSGFVHSAEDGEALARAGVSLAETRYGTVANEKGFYVLAGIPAGRYRLVISHAGYRPEVRAIDLEERTALDLSVELAPQPIEIEAVEVHAGPEERTLEPSKLTLQTRELGRVPSIAEVDLFRAVQTLPGVSSLSDFSSGLYVRGGSADQNLILLDDVDVYNPSHLFGFFSTFNVDAVKTVDLQKSGYPARYGGRLSSLLDVHNRDGNRKRMQGRGRFSIIAANATLDGPWSKGSWMLAGRHTYIEPLANAADYDIPYNFYDLHAKLNYDVTPSNKTSLSAFRGRDRLDWDQQSLDVLLDWGNDTGSLQWTHLFGNDLFSHFVLGGSRFESKGIIAFQDFEFGMANRIEDISLKGNLSYAPSSRHLIDFGFETKALDFLFRRSRGDEELEFSYDGFYGALYGQDSWELSPLWQVQPGLRLDYYSGGDYFDLGPRITVRRRLDPLTSIHLTYGRYFQYLNLVSEEGASFADMWFPVDETLAPGRADQIVLGVDLGPFESFDLSVEAYWKEYGNLVEFSEEFGNSLIEENADLGEAFLSGDGRAWGGEVFIRNRYRGFEGWVGYALGDTRRTIRGFNYGEEFHPAYDRRHQIVLMQEKDLGRRWNLTMQFRYGSGQPTTLASGRYAVRDITGREYETVLPGDLNAHRLPDYHRLDVGLTYRIEFGSWTIEPNLQIVNLYNHENVYIRYYDTTENPVETEDVTMLPFLPTIGVNVAF
ncbi:MAG: TonB-dependent receptor plug domain-containing protein [Candidatus Eisenbacteria bacterium]|nr:TonB-dependent receptor plug domain-containing protein [Candidatus Latescibacterota bacterium]MBD3301894.1 TonB-dependent receptor plug domain-containing protein [Candidatus Eisenbacteria bacterium]